MVELTKEQITYLLYASAYTEANTVTKSTVRSYLPNEWKGKADKLYDILTNQGFIKQTSKGRFSVTQQGESALVANLVTITDYKFDSVKGPKVLNTLLICIRKAAQFQSQSQSESSEEMAFDEFQKKFRALYLEERKQQELRGAVAIYSQKLLQKFGEQNSISEKKLNQYFELLKKNRNIFTVIEKEHELMEWAE